MIINFAIENDEAISMPGNTNKRKSYKNKNYNIIYYIYITFILQQY